MLARILKAIRGDPDQGKVEPYGPAEKSRVVVGPLVSPTLRLKLQPVEGLTLKLDADCPVRETCAAACDFAYCPPCSSDRCPFRKAIEEQTRSGGV